MDGKTSKMCIHDGCMTTASFNYMNEKKALYCTRHKKENMVNMKIKRCVHDECSRRAYFNYVGEKKVLYCAKHKREGMISKSKKRKRAV